MAYRIAFVALSAIVLLCAEPSEGPYAEETRLEQELEDERILGKPCDELGRNIRVEDSILTCGYDKSQQLHWQFRPDLPAEPFGRPQRQPEPEPIMVMGEGGCYRQLSSEEPCKSVQLDAAVAECRDDVFWSGGTNQEANDRCGRMLILD